MARFNWSKAREKIPADPGRIEQSERIENRIQAYKLRKSVQQAAQKPRHRRRSAVHTEQKIKWPVHVTAGANPDGTLKTFVLKSREHADSLGFSWAGRPSSV